MNCAEFQKVLPYIIESGGNADEEAHLRSCPVCSDLVQDLRYIAEQAKLLLPMHDPNPRVWTGIRGTLEREGMVRPRAGAARFRPQAAVVLSQRKALSTGWLLAFAALLLFSITLIWIRGNGAHSAETTASAPMTTQAASVSGDEEDAKVLNLVQQRAPTMLATYSENLKSVNSYIRDAKRSVDEDPDDAGARDQLIRAYNQKEVLYDMALSHTAE